MVTYKSRYAELSFYAGGRERKFSDGVYVAETLEEIAVLERLVDAIPETIPEVNAEPAPDVAEQSVKPARKPAKASAK